MTRRTKQTIQSLVDTKSLRLHNIVIGSDRSLMQPGLATSPSSSTASAFGQSTDCLTVDQRNRAMWYAMNFDAMYERLAAGFETEVQHFDGSITYKRLNSDRFP